MKCQFLGENKALSQTTEGRESLTEQCRELWSLGGYQAQNKVFT